MKERAARQYTPGDKYHFFYKGQLRYGELDALVREGNATIAYMKSTRTDTRTGKETLFWYMINTRWLLLPADVYALQN